MFPELPANLTDLSDEELSTLLDTYVSSFDEASGDEATLSDELLAQLATVVEDIERLRGELGTRQEAANTRREQLAQLGARVNASTIEGDPEAAPEGDGDETPPADEPAPEEAPAPAPAEAQTASAARPAASLTAGLRASAPIRTRPRPTDAREGGPSIVASADVPGIPAGGAVRDLHHLAELMSERHHTLGQGNGDRVTVARFNRNLPDDRKLSRDLSSAQLDQRLGQFSREPDSIRAAGGLCAPVNSYYEQSVVADASRPVRDALANFGADRGGIRYNPPPVLADVTSGIGVITAAQDASNVTKGSFSVTCNAATETDIAAIYNQLIFGNFGARAWPEVVDAWQRTALAVQARRAEQFLLDGISAVSRTVTTTGLVGAGRELFARLGQAAAGYRNRNRMRRDARLTVLLPAWTLDLVQADFARTFTDETGLISMTDGDITALFGTRNLDVSWYLDSETGGNQVLTAIGQTFVDGATTSGDATLDSTAGVFTSGDVGYQVDAPGLFPAGTTVLSVTTGTATLSANALATSSAATFTIQRPLLSPFPETVISYMFPTGAILHLDAGTLDLGLVRDSTLNASNQFAIFTENFENVARVGQEAYRIVMTLDADGTYGAAKSIDRPLAS